MIRLVQAEDRALRKFCQESAFGCRILTAAECYPMASFAAFWTQWDSEKICAAVSRIESDGTVCCGSLSAEQREELALFVCGACWPPRALSRRSAFGARAR